ncbi:MAG: hypothetical protein B7Z75_05495 [Acidocella sp. 20-57-95]|nr:MAG: hypothetical protein B7Z75_05495 [Acidocella sp. 20-57-95]OYV59502.1 MAG: hypothetical protein B7Z71_07930 [Acidocella sp. 21-58-7]HQT64601.1 DUF427 domain-containing protein [Acidocella sp.]HQU04392.1 DUF427 domain-containing protein [Acidocella sp.]
MSGHIKIVPNAKRVVVKAGGAVIADTRAAVTLLEGTSAGVLYIPRADANMSLLHKTSHTTTCPYKGLASYYSIPAAGAKAVNAVWSYENPIADVAGIKEYLAFYPNRVDSIEELA